MPEALLTSVPGLASLLFCLAAAAVAGLHLLLLLGVPIGHMTMGGKHTGVLPAPMRVGSAIQGLLVIFLALIVLKSAGLIQTGLVPDWHWLIWLPVGISAVSLVLNSITTSRAERSFGVPATASMLIGSLIVALTG
ncbi:hypothetical protein [Halovulum sp. GXIMD14793]